MTRMTLGSGDFFASGLHALGKKIPRLFGFEVEHFYF